METGKAYLIHCGDWHTFVGRCVGHVGPHTYKLEKASKIRDTTNGDVWHLLAAGDAAARKKADYIHYETSVILPLAIVAFEWVGKTPAEEQLGAT